VVVVGSGPVGAAVAAVVADLRAGARILVLEQGGGSGSGAGQSLRVIPSAERRRRDADQRDSLATVLEVQSRDASGLRKVGIRSCVGGTGSVWSGAAPRPRAWERPDFLPEPEMNRRLTRAEKLLGVRVAAAGSEDPVVLRTRAAIGRIAGRRRRTHPPRSMPVALTGGLRPVPTATHDLLRGARGAVAIRDRSLCRRLLLGAAGQVRAVEVVDLPTGRHLRRPRPHCRHRGQRAAHPAAARYQRNRPPVARQVLPRAPDGHRGRRPPGRCRRRPATRRRPHDWVIGRTWLPAGPHDEHAHGQVLHMAAAIPRHRLVLRRCLRSCARGRSAYP
jgi:hypothetical protein